MITAFALNLIGQELTEGLVEQLLHFILNLIILTIVFYIAGRIVVGKKRALFSDAFVISLLGTIVMSICLSFFKTPLVGAVLSLIIWLLLVKHYYETGWLGAIAVGIMALIVSIVILVILASLLVVSFVLF